MAQGLFLVGFTIDEVKQILAKAKAQLLQGKTIMEWEASGTKTRKEQAMPIRTVLEECAYALQQLDPDTYGKTVCRTQPRYV